MHSVAVPFGNCFPTPVLNGLVTGCESMAAHHGANVGGVRAGSAWGSWQC